MDATLVRDLSGAIAAADDEAAQTAIAKRSESARIKRSATERLDDPPPATGLVLIERVGRSIERELTLIERVVGGHHVKTCSARKPSAAPARWRRWRAHSPTCASCAPRSSGTDPMTTSSPATSTNCGARFRDDWSRWSEAQRNYLLQGMSEAELAFLDAQWDIFAHDHQRPPERAPNGQPWLTWLMIGGHGAGKTRAGAEWIRCQALGLPPFAAESVSRIALVSGPNRTSAR
jgi:hypothetical protein